MHDAVKRCELETLPKAGRPKTRVAEIVGFAESQTSLLSQRRTRFSESASGRGPA